MIKNHDDNSDAISIFEQKVDQGGQSRTLQLHGLDLTESSQNEERGCQSDRKIYQDLFGQNIKDIPL
jgi:hypothetical protein